MRAHTQGRVITQKCAPHRFRQLLVQLVEAKGFEGEATHVPTASQAQKQISGGCDPTMLRKLLKRGGGAVPSSKPATKRSKPEAANDADDAEIRRLEAKLGLKGTNKKRNAQLGRALQRVGLSAGLDSLLNDLDDMEERLQTGAPTPASIRAEYEQGSDDEAPIEVRRTPAAAPAEPAAVSEEEISEEESDDSERSGVEDEEGDEEKDIPETGGAGAGDAVLPPPSAGAWVPASRRGLLRGITSGKGEQTAQAAPAEPKKRQSLYGQDAPSVDPHLRDRMKQLSDENPEYVKIKRRVQVRTGLCVLTSVSYDSHICVLCHLALLAPPPPSSSPQGIVNRLSEASLDPLSSEITTIYDTSSKAYVNAALTEALLSVAGTETQVLRPLVMVFAALVSALHIRVNPSVSGHILEKIVRRCVDEKRDCVCSLLLSLLSVCDLNPPYVPLG